MSFEIKNVVAEPRPPLVSFVLFSFNQEEFIADALAGAFAQTYSPLQIILSDDCSSDRTFDIMKESARNYRGPHQIVLNRNEQNLGIGRHINKLVELAEGEWIVGAAGDDVSVPTRTEKIMAAATQAGGRAMSIWSRAQHMQADGTLLDIFEQSSGEAYSAKDIVGNKRVVMGCSHAWHREVFQVFGPLYHKVMFEDNAISFRSFLLGEIVYIDETLVQYRQHAANLTNYVKSLDADLLYAKMFRRRQLALVGIHQRMLDVITYRLHKSSDQRVAVNLYRMLKTHLFVQSFKTETIHRFRWLDSFASKLRRGLRGLGNGSAHKAAAKHDSN